jgi:hypothetical protein
MRGARIALRFIRATACCSRHCEERSDEAIQNLTAALDCFAPLAMTQRRT